MSSAPGPAQNLTPQQQEKAQQYPAWLKSVPSWVYTPFKPIYLACTTAIQLIIYMGLHWLVGRFFGDYIAADFPEMRRYLEVGSAGVFFYLICKSLWDLVWEERPRFKTALKKSDKIE